MAYKNIAVLMTALDSDVQADTLRGIQEYGKKHGCNVATFLWFTGAYEKAKHNLGEINIANLPDLNLFDGVIVFSNALHMEINRKKIEDILEEVTCPVVCIGDKVKDGYHVSTDSYTAMKKLVEHFVVDHQMKKIHFVKGIEGNGDGDARYQAYVDVLTEHGIPIVPERISHGDFYVAGGELAARDILNSTLPFPEAIICANDIMALTIMDILTGKGYKIPEDVAMSGYDYSLEGQCQSPQLTTVRSRFHELGQKACEVLDDLLQGKDVDKEILIPDELVIGGSCGCKNHKEDTMYSGRNNIYKDISQKKLLNNMITFEKNIMESVDYEDWLNSMKEFICQINPPEFYFCANENFVQDVFGLDTMVQEDVDLEERLAFSPVTNNILTYQNGMFKAKPSFESRYAFDDMFKDSEKPKLYIFSPIHYLDRTFGYVVFVDCDFTINNSLYIDWLINMANTIENIRKQSLLKNAMARLDEMYIRDSLTSAYNRFGMERFFSELKKRCLMSHVLMQVSFVDIDGLKKINDIYGHDEGDRIISAAAKILQKRAGKNYVIRYGGDEFIVMGSVRAEKEVENYWNAVMEEVRKYNNTNKRQAELSMSYGCEIFKVDTDTSLEDCIRIVDGKMYNVKKEKKEKNSN